MAKITIKEEGPIAGIWASCEKGTIALIASEPQGAYIAFYPKGESDVPCCVSMDGEGNVQIQTSGNPKDVKFFPLEKLAAAMATPGTSK